MTCSGAYGAPRTLGAYKEASAMLTPDDNLFLSTAVWVFLTHGAVGTRYRLHGDHTCNLGPSGGDSRNVFANPDHDMWRMYGAKSASMHARAHVFFTAWGCSGAYRAPSTLNSVDGTR